MPGSMTDFLENALANHVLGNTAYTAPTTVYVGLFTVLPADDGTGGTEATGGSYARVSMTNNTTNWPNGGSPKQNGIDITFTTFTASIGTIVGWGIWDASTSGNLLFYGDFAEAQKAFTSDTSDLITCPGHGYSAGDTVRFSAVNGTLPSGMSALTTYYVISGGLATDAFKVSATSGGSALDLTTVGSGIVARVAIRAFGSGDIAKIVANALKIYWF